MRSTWPRPITRKMVIAFNTTLVLSVMASLSAQTVPESSSRFEAPDRTMLSMLNSSRELLDEGRLSEAIELLNTILKSEVDFFFEASLPGNPVRDRRTQSLRNEATKILDQMPQAAQEAYELRFGSVARKLLDQALLDGCTEQIESVQRLYFHTIAGHEARYLVGNLFLSQGRFGQAANCFRTLRISRQATRFEPNLSLRLATCWMSAGDTRQAQEVMIDLQKRFPNARLNLEGQSTELLADSNAPLDPSRKTADTPQSLTKIQNNDRATLRDDPTRQGRGNGHVGMLTQANWRQAVSQSVEVELTLRAQRNEFFRQLTPAIPSVTPLVIDKTIVMRTPQRLVAVDISTGKCLWAADLAASPSGIGTASQTENSPSATVDKLTQRMWQDRTFGSLSSDGEVVFVLEGFGAPAGSNDDLARRFPNSANTGRRCNVLSAYRRGKTSGERIWSINRLGDDWGRSEEPFVLGPPLPLGDGIYSVVEFSGEIRLVMLHPRDGQLLWSQSLALIDTKRDNPTLRRISGISPSFADGILICPTGAGAVVAIDLNTRSLLWAHEYPSPFFERQLPAPPNTWTDACAVISGRRVIINPAESLQMHCLDLTDGSLQWSLDRGDRMFLACVDRGLAIAVGSRELTAIEVDSGKVAAGWPIRLPPESLPCGRGYAFDGNYYLPLNSNGKGEIAAIRFDPPGIAYRSQWPGGTIPGNLISHRGKILSQSVDCLESFHQSPMKP